ncbi:MAG TPA: DUF433 domain-containing protein [Rhodospirillales bacterium]|nr:DUF433 domain-containing protein [Rhodospirillales bacterium]
MTQGRITSNPEIMMGKPVVRGTRLTVEHILRRLGSTESIEQLLEDHPGLTVEDIRAAQAFAADFIAGEDVIAAE